MTLLSLLALAPGALASTPQPLASDALSRTLDGPGQRSSPPAGPGQGGLGLGSDVDLSHSRGTAALQAQLRVYGGPHAGLVVHGEAGFLPGFKAWRATAGAGATLTLGGTTSHHLSLSGGASAQWEASWGQEPVRDVESQASLTAHVVTRSDVTWEVEAQVDPLSRLQGRSWDGAVGVRRVHAPWGGSWHDVRFALGLELRDSAPAQAWLDSRVTDARTLPEVMPYPTVQVWWVF